MTTATEETGIEIPNTPEALAEEQAAFDSVVDDDPTDSEEGTPEKSATSNPSTEEEESLPVVGDEPAKDPAEPVTEAEEEDRPANITDKEFKRLMKAATDFEDVKAALDKRFNDLGGKIGGLERYYADQKKNGGGKKLQLTTDHLKELLNKEDGFPELGEKVMLGVNRLLEEAWIGGGGLSKEETLQLFREEQAGRELTKLARKHKDWLTIVGPPFEPDAPDDKVTPYWRWVRAQGEDEYRRLYQSVDHEEVAESISAYKESLKPAEKTSTTPAPKKGPSEREQALRRAVPVRGAGGPSPKGSAIDEDAAMLEGAREEARLLGLK